MVLFSRETKRLRARHNQLKAEVRGLMSKEARMQVRLHKLLQSEAELQADKSELQDGD